MYVAFTERIGATAGILAIVLGLKFSIRRFALLGLGVSPSRCVPTRNYHRFSVHRATAETRCDYRPSLDAAAAPLFPDAD
jgi:hypothetical protein